MITERWIIKSGGQVDKLCHRCLVENCGKGIPFEYTAYSQVIPIWNPIDLNNAVENLRLKL